DRVHRIGQERDVSVYLPLAIHPRVGERSFDVLLHNLLERKRTLSGSVLTPVAPSEGEIAAVLDEALDA
ncbi:MAG TPA: hypothetical protein PK141_27190, partial [Polyangiaceae bacterium]|nr:hypothetical protein [Polyangiaceae bacterium]